MGVKRVPDPCTTQGDCTRPGEECDDFGGKGVFGPWADSVREAEGGMVRLARVGSSWFICPHLETRPHDLNQHPLCRQIAVKSIRLV
jgi:hypothetical protein